MGVLLAWRISEACAMFDQSTREQRVKYNFVSINSPYNEFTNWENSNLEVISVDFSILTSKSHVKLLLEQVREPDALMRGSC